MSNYSVTTLEKMQYDVLQGDLSTNSLLQSSPIPAKDKELKTKAKKIIPAINELLKVVETCKESVELYASQIESKVNEMAKELSQTLKQEQAKSFDDQLKKLDEQLKSLVDEMQETLKKSYADEMEKRLEDLSVQIDQNLEKKIDNLRTELGNGGEVGVMKKRFLSKVSIEKGGTAKAPFKFSEIQNIEEQIMGVGTSSYSNSRTWIHPLFNFTHSDASLYSIHSTPIDVRVDPSTDEVTLANTSGLYPVTIYFFEME